jgi:hypothetical protein
MGPWMGQLGLLYQPNVLSIFAINLLINKISMDPCRVFDSWGHGKIPICKFK